MQTSKLSKIASVVILVVGVVMFLSYLAYLPMPGVFESEQAPNIGLILYSLASAGCAFVAWGMMLSKMDDTGISKQNALKSTGVGLMMLGLMRLGTSVFPHEPFDQLIFLPISEFIVFTVLGIKFYKS